MFAVEQAHVRYAISLLENGTLSQMLLTYWTIIVNTVRCFKKFLMPSAILT